MLFYQLYFVNSKLYVSLMEQKKKIYFYLNKYTHKQIDLIKIKNQLMSVKIPFLNANQQKKSDTGFVDMVQNRICPNFQAVSFTTALVGACIIIFVFSRVVYSAGGYSQFLQSPIEMNKFALDIELIKSNRAYYYQTVTAMFLHYSYIHIISNVIFAFFIMYEIESCWRWGILASLVAGFAANSLAIATMDGILMGFSGVLCACVGIQLAALILHCSYLQATYGRKFYMMFFFCIILIIMILGSSAAALVHFYGLFFGLIFGLTLYPRMEQVNINANIDKLFKIFSVGFLGLAVLLGLIV